MILRHDNICPVDFGCLIHSMLGGRLFVPLPSKFQSIVGISRGPRAASIAGVVSELAFDLVPFLLPCFSPPIPYFQELGIANHFILRKPTFSQYDIVSFEHWHKSDCLWACTLEDGVKKVDLVGAKIFQLLLGSDRKIAWGAVRRISRASRRRRRSRGLESVHSRVERGRDSTEMLRRVICLYFDGTSSAYDFCGLQ